jgi:hypothetical protein
MMRLDAGDEDFAESMAQNHSTGKTNRELTFYILKD